MRNTRLTECVALASLERRTTEGVTMLIPYVKVRLPWLGIVIPDWQCKIGAILNTKPNKWTNGQIVSTKLLFTPYFLDKYNEF